jgi:hypothetical protein
MDRPEGQPPALDVPDVLVVAPYNAQVAEIASLVQRRLGVLPNVGTVDKFQGREAPVAIYSMTTSSPKMRRATSSSHSGNRLNVATSRARASRSSPRRPTCSVRAGRRRRCGWRTRSAAIRRWR